MFHFCCDRCALTLDREYRPRVYVIGPEEELAIEQRHVWCARCATVTPAAVPFAAHPARCLRCGAQDVALPDSEWADLPHAGCGGVLRCSCTIIGGTSARTVPHRYSIDGELLEIGRTLGMFAGEPDEPLSLW